MVNTIALLRCLLLTSYLPVALSAHCSFVRERFLTEATLLGTKKHLRELFDWNQASTTDAEWVSELVLTSAPTVWQIPRGGGGGGGCLSSLTARASDPVNVAKVATTLSGLMGLILALTPKKANELYGLTPNQNHPFAIWITRQNGTGLVAYAVSVFLLVTQRITLYQGVQLSHIFFVLEYLRFFWNNEAKEVGFTGDLTPLYWAVVVMSLTVLAMSHDSANLVVKIICISWGLDGVIKIVNPQRAMLVLKFGGTVDESSATFISSFGYYLVATAVFQGSMALGTTAIRAFGYSSIVWLVYHLNGLIVNGDYKTADLRNVRLFWIILHLLACGTALLK